MTRLIINIFDFVKRHRWMAFASLMLLTVLMALQLTRITYKEEISDFLPLDGAYEQSMELYRRIAGGDRIVGVVELTDTLRTDPDVLVEAVDVFAERLEMNDTSGMAGLPTTQMDLEKMAEVTGFIYDNIPLFLDPDRGDYDHIRQLIHQPGYVEKQMAGMKQMLMFPASGLLAENLSRDPLNIFTPVVEQLRGRSSAVSYELYDGHIFSPDMRRAFIMMESPFGASETKHNGLLMELLDSTARQTEAEINGVSIHFTGGPVIAVGNARQIKNDSLIAVALAAVIIMLLLFTTLRSLRNILLIAVSIAWGWLFAMAGLSLVHNDVSIIVVGISSIIVGIAVNYPLHLIAHLRHTPDRRLALKEIVAPLMVGNITTVGAFLALVPLKSVALRDLGLFAAFLLVGTILFVLLYLPHLAKVEKTVQKNSFIDKVGDFSLESKRWIGITVVLVTLVLVFFSFQTGFDTDFSHINYMDDRQKTDMELLRTMTASPDGTVSLYVVCSDSTAEGALRSDERMENLLEQLKADGMVKENDGCQPFIASMQTQEKRIKAWREFVEAEGTELERAVKESALQEGFTSDSFDDFNHVLHADFHPQPLDFFQPVIQALFSGNIILDGPTGKFAVVNVAQVLPENVEKVEERLNGQTAGQCLSFDINHLNETLANTLSDNFNYIGWACGLIVFFFLWASMGSLELALLSFLPMAVSWIWILGLMAILGIQFNVVNVILATFIFGQGDDYTIFMTEGCQYEYAYRKKMLSSYKSSIILSALIMFVGIGTLIIARHPALHSLALLTIVGMFSVVLMAYLLPPLIFRWMVMKNGTYRLRPISLNGLLYGGPKHSLAMPNPKDQKQVASFVKDRYRYKGADIVREVNRSLSSGVPDMMEIENKQTEAIIKSIAEFHRVTGSADALVCIKIEDRGYGEQAIAYAISHPDRQVIAVMTDDEQRLVATYSAENITPNLHIVQSS